MLLSLWTCVYCRKRGDDAARYATVDTKDKELSEKDGSSEPIHIAHTFKLCEASTTQIFLQILSVTLQNFKDIGTLSLVPIFLGSPQPSASDTDKRTLAGGFGFNTENTSSVLLTQAIAAILC